MSRTRTGFSEARAAAQRRSMQIDAVWGEMSFKTDGVPRAHRAISFSRLSVVGRKRHKCPYFRHNGAGLFQEPLKGH